MTSKRFVRRFNAGRFTPKKSAQMNRARWDADRARRDAEAPARMRELAIIEAENLPRRAGHHLGTLEWHDAATGQTRRWVVRIGKRVDQITIEAPGLNPSRSMGWSQFLTMLRKHLTL